MKDSRKSRSFLQAGSVFLFCICMSVGCTDNTSKTKTETNTMEEKKDTMPALDHDSSSTRPETIKNGGPVQTP